ncbi:transcriptional regulator LldR [Marinobacterium nitratireducens]|uniref:Pyruvate dehydrogenase complex repressor n=1 Tax=Marinobacterium nitratireducens TaxID=518897 RepID=A0A917ZHC8_9GAMM|nr:FCD domain-containing protein [Marinobacterium nitratireducens]GGO82014.1 transcriptional regulator LldR [Marinobacterium nitratireducens]
MERQDKAGELAARLSARVLDGSIAPGALLPSERQLAAEHGLSRATVRQALRTLALQGLVETRQGDGTRARNLLESQFQMPAGAADSLALQLQVMEVRATLEGEAAWYCATRASDGELARIDEEYRRMSLRSEGITTLAKAKADLTFHQMIAGASHNLLLISFTQLFYSRYFNAIYGVLDRTLRQYGRYPDGIRAQHAAIHQALMERDAEAARQRATEHILFTRSLLESCDG